MKNKLISLVRIGSTALVIVAAIFAVTSSHAEAYYNGYYGGGQSYSYGGGYGGGYGYNGYHNYNGNAYNGGYAYVPPTYQIPTRNIPAVQVIYSNGYYQNYFVPTVRYFPPTYQSTYHY